MPAGMPASIFHDKYARRKGDGSYETWSDVAARMVAGNLDLSPLRHHYLDVMLRIHYEKIYQEQRDSFLRLAREGVIPMSGRHLQHGDSDQPNKIGDLFANCTSAMFCWASFLLLMKGAGVGRDYSSGVCWVDWNNLPDCRFVLDAPDNMGRGGHPDYEPWIETLADARHKYDADSEKVRWFGIEDSAEGWAKVVMIMETAAFHKNNRDTVFVFDFSKVRKAGSPLLGQQGRPASGPVPFIRALHQVMTIKNAGFKPWKQALFIDHFLAACVVVGGVRRSARLASKYWRDRDVIEFIDIKRGGFLWSANNSIAVDAEFWVQARSPKPSHGRRVFEAAVGASYYDDTGEPGFFNVDLINEYLTDLDSVTAQNYISDEYKRRFGDIHPKTFEMIDYMLFKAKHHVYKFTLNPCGEIPLAIWGANCYVGDVCLANAGTALDAIDACRRLAEALVRVNTMPCLYQAEVRRTNRIGVSLTGLHEFAWDQFNLGFLTMLLPHNDPTKAFWSLVSDMRLAVESAAAKEAQRCGLPPPATATTVKPSGTVAKVMNCTEGVHLPATRHYIRWVMRTAIEAKAFAERGYPVKDVSAQYANTWVVGFPTCLPFIEQIPDDMLVTASEATPEEQYQWLKLLEQNWLGGERRNNQISYTLKWKKSVTSFEQYMAMILEHQPQVRCCSLMPELEQDASAYAYLPEEPVSKERYDELMAAICDRTEAEPYDKDRLACEGGACPIEPDLRQGESEK